MTILGIWPENNKTTLKVIMSNVRTIVILNIMVWGVTIPAVHSLIRIRNDIMSVIDNLQYSIPFLMAVLKLLIMWQKKKSTHKYFCKLYYTKRQFFLFLQLHYKNDH